MVWFYFACPDRFLLSKNSSLIIWNQQRILLSLAKTAYTLSFECPDSFPVDEAEDLIRLMYGLSQIQGHGDLPNIYEAETGQD